MSFMKVSGSSSSPGTTKIDSPSVATSKINGQSNEIQRTHLHKVGNSPNKPNSRLQLVQKGMREPTCSTSMNDVTKIGDFSDDHQYDLPSHVIDEVEVEFDNLCEQFDAEDELMALAAELPKAQTETILPKAPTGTIPVFPAVPKHPIKDSLAENLSSLDNSKRLLKKERSENRLASLTDSEARKFVRQISLEFERANPHQQSTSSISAHSPPKSRAQIHLEKQVGELRRQIEQKEREVEALELNISEFPAQSRESKSLIYKLAKVATQLDQTEKRLQKAIQQLSFNR